MRNLLISSATFASGKAQHCYSMNTLAQQQKLTAVEEGFNVFHALD